MSRETAGLIVIINCFADFPSPLSCAVGTFFRCTLSARVSTLTRSVWSKTLYKYTVCKVFGMVYNLKFCAFGCKYYKGGWRGIGGGEGEGGGLRSSAFFFHVLLLHHSCSCACFVLKSLWFSTSSAMIILINWYAWFRLPSSMKTTVLLPKQGHFKKLYKNYTFQQSTWGTNAVFLQKWYWQKCGPVSNIHQRFFCLKHSSCLLFFSQRSYF